MACVELWGECYDIETTTTLDLSNSGLTGEIPPKIGNLTNLEYLYLSFNQLTGDIPPEIWEITNLRKLWLNDNQLTGEIPYDICNRAYSSLNLGANQLCPPYPDCAYGEVTSEDEQDTSNCP